MTECQLIGRCPYCAAPSREDRLSLGFLRCSGCGLLIRRSQPTVQELDEFYKAEWLSPMGSGATGATNKNVARYYALNLARTMGRKDLSGLRILELGAGRGDFAIALMALGAEVIASDPFSYEELQRRGVKGVASLDDLQSRLTFDVVVSNSVIEHLPVPWKVLRDLRTRLVEGGWLYISTPNAISLAARVQNARWSEARNRGHMFLFTPKCLQKILAENGYSSVVRQRWLVRYARSLPRRTLQAALQLTGIAGEMHFIARRAAGEPYGNES